MESSETTKIKQIPHIIIPETDESSSDESIRVTSNKKKKLCVKSDSDENNSPKVKKLRLQSSNNSNDEVPEMIRETSKLTISRDGRSSCFDLRVNIKLLHNSSKPTTWDDNNEINDAGASQDISDCQSLDDINEFFNNSLATFSDDNTAPELMSHESSNDSVTEPAKRVRHKIARPHEWKQNKRRIARNLGLPYKSHNGVHRPGRKLLPPCNFEMRCFEKFTQVDRCNIFKGFWSLGDVNRQRELIGKLVKVKKINRPRTEQNISRRRYTLRYRFKKADKYVRACKVFFLNTFGIGEKILRVVINKYNRSGTGALSPDQRGRNIPRNKLSEDDIAGINRHISLLPKVPAHWCRRDSTKTYLEGNLDQETVYRLYQSYASQHGLRQVSKPIYVRQLNLLNIGFHQPRKDQCWCARFHELPEEDKIAKQDEYDLHARRKEAAREEKIIDTNAAKNPKIMIACFDMEALLYSPWTSTKQLFYKRKLATHNFTGFSIRKKQGYCYMWPEHFGNKGSQEIATCLSKYIQEEVPNGVKKLTFYADNCAGQNKNSVIAIILGKALQMHPSLKKINLKFLEVGHTFMECDTMHLTIERTSRNQNVYVPADWAKIARHAKKTGNQYSVFSMTHNDFLNFKAARDKIFSNNIRFTDSTKVKWKLAKWIQVRRDRLRSIFIKNEYWEPFNEISLRKEFTSGTLKRLYDDPITIKRAKHDDLMHLCRANIIPKQYHGFYRDLPVDENDGNELNPHDGRARVPRRR